MNHNGNEYVFNGEQLSEVINAISAVDLSRCSQESVINVINKINSFLAGITVVIKENSAPANASGEQPLENIDIPKLKPEEKPVLDQVEVFRILGDLEVLLNAFKNLQYTDDCTLNEERYQGFIHYIKDYYRRLPEVLPYLKSEEELTIEDKQFEEVFQQQEQLQELPLEFEEEHREIK